MGGAAGRTPGMGMLLACAAARVVAVSDAAASMLCCLATHALRRLPRLSSTAVTGHPWSFQGMHEHLMARENDTLRR